MCSIKEYSKADVEHCVSYKVDGNRIIKEYELIRRGYDTDKTIFYYRSRNDKEVDFVLRKGSHLERLVQVCYDMSSPKTEKREVDSLTECAGELKCDNLVIVTNNDERTIEKDGYKINVMPISKF